MRFLSRTYHLVPVFVGLVILISVPGRITAQIISPGRLSESHSFLEGISKCTQCHELGEPNILNQKCLDCHSPVEKSISELNGFHGREEIIEQSCSSCHIEHFGADFDLLHFDSTKFNHEITGFELDGSHDDIECSSCHSETSFIVDSTVIAYFNSFDLIAGKESTFLGLNAECSSCHVDDNSHGNQFLTQGCESCHTTERWEEALNFDHSDARFQLTGQHIDVACTDCHKPMAFNDTLITRFVEIPFGSCENCHEDVHDGRMTQLNSENRTCESCHNTEGWHTISASFSESTFSHEDTGYALIGAHTEISCRDCHSSRNDDEIVTHLIVGTENNTYPVPQSETCMDCHVDYHEGVFEYSQSGADCESCHTSESWYPSTFGLQAHNSRSRFELAGAHLATACFSCHVSSSEDTELDLEESKPKFVFEDISCLGCHEDDNPHGDLDQLWEGSHTDNCESCHTEQSWSATLQFNHASVTGYELIGQHSNTSCRSCHFDSSLDNVFGEALSFSTVSAECEDCHQPESPHQGQFEGSVLGESCGNCHDTESFRMTDFDHSLTSFPLDGGHINVACSDCHTQEISEDGQAFTRFFPLSTECSSCHED